MGYGDITPNNGLERFFCYINMSLGVVVFSFASGSLSSIMSNYDTNEAELNNKLMLVHSFQLGKRLVKMGNHLGASRMLIRVSKNISQFPSTTINILTTRDKKNGKNASISKPGAELRASLSQLTEQHNPFDKKCVDLGLTAIEQAIIDCKINDQNDNSQFCHSGAFNSQHFRSRSRGGTAAIASPRSIAQGNQCMP